MATLLTSVDDIPESGSYRFTVREPSGEREEVILVVVDGEVSAWKNFCLHETDQRLDTGDGVTMRDDLIVCPRHASAFEAGSGRCHNGPAAGATLAAVDVAVRHGNVYLTDDDVTFCYAGGLDDDDSPGSTSHLRF